MLTPCVGRADVLAQVSDLVQRVPWTTLTGPPGSGKSLIARHVVADHPDVVWVDGQQATSVEALLASCLDALQVESAPGETVAMSLQRALTQGERLMVLDGVDGGGGSLDGLGRFIEEVVEVGSATRFLCTAAGRAGSPTERVVRVGPLPVPGPRSPLTGAAVDLLQTAITASGSPELDLVTQDADVRRVIASTGGLPALLALLGSHIGLLGLSDVVPTGHLQSAVRRSYDLLDEDSRRCFRRLAVVDGAVPFDALSDLASLTAEQTAHVAGTLSRGSLVEVTADARLRILAPMRAVALGLPDIDRDREAALAGALAWGQRVIPADHESGAGDEPWLADLPLLRDALAAAARDDATRGTAYELVNRMFPSLYTALRTRELVDIFADVLASGDGPADLGAQVARRAGIAASEARGTYAGLSFLDRAEEHAATSSEPTREYARNASIRAEMHLDAGALGSAREEAERALALSAVDAPARLQACRTLMEVAVATGNFAEALTLSTDLLSTSDPDIAWVALSARTLLGCMAFEQGLAHEAAAHARTALAQAIAMHEDRIALLADVLLRYAVPAGDRGGEPILEPPEGGSESLPWAVRLRVELQDARDAMAAGAAAETARLAADLVVQADGAQLGRDALEARLLLGDALIATGDHAQAVRTHVAALKAAAAMPQPLRVADALDGLAASLTALGSKAGVLVALGAALRAHCEAEPLTRPGVVVPSSGAVEVPNGWVATGQLSDAGLHAALALVGGEAPPVVAAEPPVLEGLTRAERAVAEQVALGHTSKQIATVLFVSPRTVDSHLASIYRKLEIPSRARLAALMTGAG